MQESALAAHDRSYSKCMGVLLLSATICLLVLNVCELASFRFHAARILDDLREWEEKQIVQAQMWQVAQLESEVETMMDRLSSLIDQEQYLLVKIKDSHIQDNKEEDQIPQISNFQTRLSMYQQILTQKSAEFKQLAHKAAQLKASKKEHMTAHFLQGFQSDCQAMVQQLTEFRQELNEILKVNQKWHANSEQKLSQAKTQPNEENADTDIEDLPQYYSLPPLAREVLKPLPMDLLKKLYSSTAALHEESELQQREKFYKERQFVARQNRAMPSFSLTKYNINSGIERRAWQTDLLSDYARVNSKYSLDGISSQKGFCIVVPTYNNGKNFRAELNLNSIFAQNYTNYKVVIIDDASKDSTPLIIQKYLRFYNISPDKCELVVNKQNRKALENIYLAIMHRCEGYEITAIVDGDDELIGFNALKVLNAVYSRRKLGVVYSNFYFYHHVTFEVKSGFNADYEDHERKNYRKAPQKFSHLITFQIELLREVKVEDLQTAAGQFYNVAYDFAMLYPLMELSCGRVKYIDQYQYLYSVGTGMNDYEVMEKEQKQIASAILKKPPYPCSQQYDR